MPKIINSPTIIKSVGNKPKIIQEYIGLVNSKTNDVSIAHMQSPGGWQEPGQRPDFDEYTIILEGILKVETENNTLFVNKGEAIITYAGEWVRYSTPDDKGANYIAVCMPAFTPETVNRDEKMTG
ncbi:MAG: cupin domain-containing protein [Fidelibacterota bacterium]|jgi:mannose-6-phosphate isomerase-like protein (cupin superfamily)|tara:strand:- start:1166 stop:1540 length:375 start_codon:yes stop_codon:yes gene_type:complete